MCRHLAYLGPPVTLREAIIDPPYGLYRQAWAPRMMGGSGTMNVDGFGVGWYSAGDPAPARYRMAGPIWADPSFADLTRVTRSGALLAAVRDASAGTEPGASAAAPYGAGNWLFSHNGTLAGWPDTAAALAGTLTPLQLLGLEARVDSALLWALTLNELRAGAAPDEALAAVVGLLEAHQVAGRFNFLLTDGEMIAATAVGQSLWYRRMTDSVVVASEPSDDGPGWTEVADRSLVSASAARISIRPLAGTPEVTPDDAERVRRGSFPEGMAATTVPDGRSPR
jgi:glutamine amidotransferase